MLMWVHELGGAFLILLVQDSSPEVFLSHRRRGRRPLVWCQERTLPALLVTAGRESTWPSLGPRSKDLRRGTTLASRECHAAGDGRPVKVLPRSARIWPAALFSVNLYSFLQIC
jgi:hypothetical protein